MLNTLQAGRGLAALAVLLFHSTMTIQHTTGVTPFWDVMQFGNRGVDFFFVLSGFIIMRAHKAHIGQPKMWRNFAWKRFARIFPIYWLYTALVVMALMVGLGNSPLPQSGAEWFSTISLFRITDSNTPLSQAWTLFHEMLFYIGFSLLIINRSIGSIVLISWFLISAATLEYIPASTDATLVFVNSYNLNFAFGIGAYYAVRHIKNWAFFVAGVGLLSVVLATIVSGFPSDILFGLGFTFLVAAGAAIEAKHTVNIPLATLVGNASYSIYLTHEVVLSVCARVATAAGFSNPYLLFVIIATSALVAGILAYKFLEKPLLNLLNGKKPV